MKQKMIYIIIALQFLFLSCQVDENIENLMGKVSFSKFSIEMFSSPLVGGQNRVLQGSTWKHQYPTSVVLQIQNNQTGQRFSLNFNPANPALSSIDLPYGNYTFFSEVTGDTFAPFLPFSTEGFFSVNSGNTTVDLNAKTNFGLISVKNQYVEKIEIRGNGISQQLSLLTDNSYFYIYVKDRTVVTLEIKESSEGKTIIREFMVNAKVHNNFVLEMKEEGALNAVDLVMDAFQFQEETISVNPKSNLPFWLNHSLDYGDVQDIDGNVYKTIKIGDLTWMAENLKTTRFCNGDEIPNITDDSEWIYNAINPAWCYYENDSSYNYIFGKIYNMKSFEDDRNVCPCGWRMPTYRETLEMLDFLGGVEIAGGKLKSTGLYWQDLDSDATNESGFSGLYSGSRSSAYGEVRFDSFGTRGEWWLDSTGEDFPYVLLLIKSNQRAYITDYLNQTRSGLSIRCVQDS